MNYILGTILESKITGVEKAQINRLKLFKQHGISSNVYMLNGILIHTHMRSNIRLKMMYLQCMTIFKKQSIIKRQSKLTGYSIGKSHVGTH